VRVIAFPLGLAQNVSFRNAKESAKTLSNIFSTKVTRIYKKLYTGKENKGYVKSLFQFFEKYLYGSCRNKGKKVCSKC